MVVEVKIEGTKELSNALVEMFSPVTEALGTLGDRVRIYRQVSLLRSLKRAKQIAVEEGLALNEPPLKFLVPYLEDCSLESPEDDTLIDMWARLLVDAARTPKSEHNLFIRILREMSAPEARLFRFIASPSTHSHSASPRHLEDVESDWRTEYVSISIRRAIDRLGGLGELTSEDRLELLALYIHEESETAGSVIYYLDIAEGVPGHYPIDSLYSSPRGPIDDDFDSSSFSILKALGLIGDFKSPEIWFGRYCFVVYTYYVTGFGAKFAQACTDIVRDTRGSSSVGST
jgi:hypothetical protein